MVGIRIRRINWFAGPVPSGDGRLLGGGEVWICWAEARRRDNLAHRSGQLRRGKLVDRHDMESPTMAAARLAHIAGSQRRDCVAHRRSFSGVGGCDLLIGGLAARSFLTSRRDKVAETVP